MTEEEKPKVHVLMLTDEDQERLTKIINKAINVIDKANDVQEKAYIVRLLIESFEENHGCVIPFKNRYTEPTFIMNKTGYE